MASEPNAVPFGPATVYGGFPDTTTWDEEKIYGCVCDSLWRVGFGVGEEQMTQYFGPDCSKRHCLTGDDPRTVDVDETDCAYWKDNGKTWGSITGSDGLYYTPDDTLPNGVTIAHDAACTPGVDCGAVGNKCHVDCANRGICNYESGQCTCFSGYYGINCASKAVQPGGRTSS